MEQVNRIQRLGDWWKRSRRLWLIGVSCGVLLGVGTQYIVNAAIAEHDKCTPILNSAPQFQSPSMELKASEFIPTETYGATSILIGGVDSGSGSGAVRVMISTVDSSHNPISPPLWYSSAFAIQDFPTVAEGYDEDISSTWLEIAIDPPLVITAGQRYAVLIGANVSGSLGFGLAHGVDAGEIAACGGRMMLLVGNGTNTTWPGTPFTQFTTIVLPGFVLMGGDVSEVLNLPPPSYELSDIITEKVEGFDLAEQLAIGGISTVAVGVLGAMLGMGIAATGLLAVGGLVALVLAGVYPDYFIMVALMGVLFIIFLKGAVGRNGGE